MSREQFEYEKFGWKPTKPENPDFKCRSCGSNNIYYRAEDDIYDDIEYECADCKKHWWVEGSDY